jgi:glycosyltransferase involved in cell wall biosynthesis
LFLQKRFLIPANFGGRIRTLNIVRHLARWHSVTYLCNIQAEDAPFVEDMRALGVQLETVPWREAKRESWQFYADVGINVFSRYPFNVNKDFDPLLRRRAAELLESGAYDLIVCDFVQMARNVIGVPGPPRLLFQHNVEAKIFERMADRESNRCKRWLFRQQQRKLERFEKMAGEQFDRVVAVSVEDRRIFEEAYGWRHVDTIDTAVDTEYFRPIDAAVTPGRMVFVGSMDWLPNQTGISHFVEAILPRIRAKFPLASLDIVGRRPPEAVQRLQSVPGVRVTGTVDDVRPHLAEAQVAIVPLYAGGGTRLKFFEYMAMAKPIVSTTIGAEGLNVEEGRNWLRADTDEDFAKQVLRLFEEPALRQQLAGASRELVVTNYNTEAVARQFERSCLRAAEGRHERPLKSMTAP